VSKQDVGSNIKFCPLCDKPMIVRMLITPCEHVVCYSCTKPTSESCYVCQSNITGILRVADKQKLFECDFPDCFRFYESLDKLALHKYLVHNQQVGFDPNLMKQDHMMPPPQMSNVRFPMNPMMQGMNPMMGMQMGMNSMMPMIPGNMMNPNFNMGQMSNMPQMP